MFLRIVVAEKNAEIKEKINEALEFIDNTYHRLIYLLKEDMQFAVRSSVILTVEDFSLLTQYSHFLIELKKRIQEIFFKPIQVELKDKEDAEIKNFRLHLIIKKEYFSKQEYINLIIQTSVSLSLCVDRILQIQDQKRDTINSQYVLLDLKRNLEQIPVALRNIQKLLPLLKEELVANAPFSLRRNFNFSIDMSKMNKNTFGTVNVRIRHLHEIDYNEEDTLFIMAKIIGHFGNIELYFKNLFVFIQNAFEQLLKIHTDLFIRVFGKKISFQVFVDISSCLNNVGDMFVGRDKMIAFQKDKIIRISSYDPANKEFTLGIPLTSVVSLLVKETTKDDFIIYLIHEFNHTFDKTLVKNKIFFHTAGLLLRTEGIAYFSQFVIGKEMPDYNIREILELITNPVSTKEKFDEINKFGSSEPYEIGSFICFVYLTFFLRKKEISINPFLKEGISELRTNPEGMKIAENLLIMLRNFSNKDFLKFYKKYSEEMGVPLIFEKTFLDKIIEEL